MKKTSWFSLSQMGERTDRITGGLSFEKVVRLLDTTGIGSEEFDARWTDLQKTNRTVTIFDGDDAEPSYREFDYEFARMLQSDCIGPISFDETDEWVEMSYVCPTQGEYEILQHISFKYSPELTVTIGLSGDKLSGVSAYEPLPHPGRGLLQMHSYEQLKKRLRDAEGGQSNG